VGASVVAKEKTEKAELDRLLKLPSSPERAKRILELLGLL
jgi:hypothetical protein